MAELAADRTVLTRRGIGLEYFTIAWNCLEGLIGIGAGLLAGSISLVGFGIDSFIWACAPQWLAHQQKH